MISNNNNIIFVIWRGLPGSYLSLSPSYKTTREDQVHLTFGFKRQRRGLHERRLAGGHPLLPSPDLDRSKCVSMDWSTRLVPLTLAQRPNLVLSEKQLLNILYRLPTPNLCRCNCVCKDWRCRLFLGISPFAHINKKGVWVPRFLSFSDGGSLRDELFPSSSFYAILEAPLAKAQVLATCNGMVLCCMGYPPRHPRVGLPNPFSTVSELVDYVLLNPVTRHHSPSSQHAFACSILLVFDPCASSHHFMVITMEFFSRTGAWRPLEITSPAIQV